MTLQEFIDTNQITLTSEYADRNPYMEDSERMDNYRVKLRSKKFKTTMRLYFSKGLGHHGAEPTVNEVLDCLASDAAGIENMRNFDDWCADYGYDTDSRRAEKTFSATLRQTKRLRKFLDPESYETLLWQIERL